MNVLWSRRAAEHIAAIRDYIEHDDLEAAERVAARISDCVHQLVKQPLMGRPGRIRGTRELVVSGTPYIAAYRVKRESLEIIAVFHGRQRWPKSL